jgi:50S ribosomal protein L16 3-hydroxylase
MITRLFRAVHLQFLLLTIITEAFFQGLTGKASFTSKLLLGNICSPVADELNGWNTDNNSEFLEKYWQKKPVLIRNAFPDIKYDVEFLTEADMFNLSYDEDVESRTLIKDKDGSWNKEYGPFDSRYTKKLPANDWTILVQEVDRHIPRVADIWQKYFNFIPSWRRDDIMVSYAAPGGGIGAHVDSYDVFLIQGRGKRIWSIENRYISDAEELRREVPNCDTRLISDFQADQEWELNEGDVLYLPPRIPHQGTYMDTPLSAVYIYMARTWYCLDQTNICKYTCT